MAGKGVAVVGWRSRSKWGQGRHGGERTREKSVVRGSCFQYRNQITLIRILSWRSTKIKYRRGWLKTDHPWFRIYIKFRRVCSAIRIIILHTDNAVTTCAPPFVTTHEKRIGRICREYKCNRTNTRLARCSRHCYIQNAYYEYMRQIDKNLIHE